MSQDSPLYPTLIQSIIDNMNLANREELQAKLQQAMQEGQPSPEEQQMQMAVQQAQLAFQESQTAALQGQAAESQARASKAMMETQLAPQELEIEFDQIFKKLEDLEEFNKNCSCGKVKSTGRKKANA